MSGALHAGCAALMLRARDARADGSIRAAASTGARAAEGSRDPRCPGREGAGRLVDASELAPDAAARFSAGRRERAAVCLEDGMATRGPASSPGKSRRRAGTMRGRRGLVPVASGTAGEPEAGAPSQRHGEASGMASRSRRLGEQPLNPVGLWPMRTTNSKPTCLYLIVSMCHRLARNLDIHPQPRCCAIEILVIAAPRLNCGSPRASVLWALILVAKLPRPPLPLVGITETQLSVPIPPRTPFDDVGMLTYALS